MREAIKRSSRITTEKSIALLKTFCVKENPVFNIERQIEVEKKQKTFAVGIQQKKLRKFMPKRNAELTSKSFHCQLNKTEVTPYFVC